MVYFSTVHSGLAGEAPGHVAFRHRGDDLHDSAADRELALTHSLAELPGATGDGEGPCTPLPRFAGAGPAGIEEIAALRRDDTPAFPLLRAGGAVDFHQARTHQAGLIEVAAYSASTLP